MTAKEKVREKKEQVDDAANVEESHEQAASLPTHEDEAQINHIDTKERGPGEKQKAQMLQSQSPEPFLPDWGSANESPWMYVVPTTEQGIRKWSKEWHDFLIDWAQQNNQHVFSFSAFIKEPPFSEIRNKRKAFSRIAESVVQDDLAKWMDEEKRKLQLQWKSEEEIAEDLYDWALKEGMIYLDLRSMVIQEEFDFGGLPEHIIRHLLNLLVQAKKAQWVDKERGTIRLGT